jgi:hypothetical protein
MLKVIVAMMGKHLWRGYGAQCWWEPLVNGKCGKPLCFKDIWKLLITCVLNRRLSLHTICGHMKQRWVPKQIFYSLWINMLPSSGHKLPRESENCVLSFKPPPDNQPWYNVVIQTLMQ